MAQIIDGSIIDAYIKNLTLEDDPLVDQLDHAKDKYFFISNPLDLIQKHKHICCDGGDHPIYGGDIIDDLTLAGYHIGGFGCAMCYEPNQIYYQFIIHSRRDQSYDIYNVSLCPKHYDPYMYSIIKSDIDDIVDKCPNWAFLDSLQFIIQDQVAIYGPILTSIKKQMADRDTIMKGIYWLPYELWLDIFEINLTPEEYKYYKCLRYNGFI